MTIAKSCLESAQIICPPALPLECGTYCDFNLNIGIFFDGTDNHKDRDTPTQSQSNIARLYDAYKDDWQEGFFSHYIEGVGTPALEKFGTDGEDPFEAAAGKGGEPRIIWGLLEVLNSIHRFVNRDDPMFNDKQMKALCTDVYVKPDNPNEWPKPIPSEDEQILKDLCLKSGLVGNEKNRKRFFEASIAKLENRLKDKHTPPHIAGIYLDVFGFSRGAAQARVFTTWLHQYLLHNGKLFNIIPAYVRMLGLMDTVTSVGSTNATLGEGHWDWATPENLRIHPAVKNCVHYVALHELRTVFPCDSIRQGSVMPPNCYEHYYPGAHSDVGGGYAPGLQGKAWQLDGGGVKPDDSKKLSQLPLNDMYHAAKSACQFHSQGQAWLDVKGNEDDTNPLIEQFAIDPQVKSSVEAYFANCNIPSHLPIDQQLREHGLLYLTWRYQITKQYGGLMALESYHYSKELDEDGLHYYTYGQGIFAEQVDVASKNMWGMYTTIASIFGKVTRIRLGRNAGEIYRRISKKINLAPEIGHFYDLMVHDSYAAFLKKLEKETVRDLTEGEGYLRYRVVYLGDDNRLNATAA